MNKKQREEGKGKEKGGTVATVTEEEPSPYHAPMSMG